MILVSLTLIVWLTLVLRQINLLTSEGQTFLLFIKITALALPSLIVTVAPVAFLIASLHTLNRLSGDSELIVLSASGSSSWRLLVPYFTLSTTVFAGVLAANIFVLPPAAKLLNDYVSQVRADLLSQVLQPGEFSDLEKGLTIHIRGKAENGDLLGVVVHDERDKASINTVVAERGEVWTDGGRSQMDLHDGQILRQQAGKPNVQFIHFETYSFDMGDFNAKTGKREPKVQELPMTALLFADKSSDYYKANAAGMISEMHQRISSPLYSLVYALLAVVYLGRPRTTREGRTNVLFTAFLVGAAVLALGIAGVNIVGKKAWALSLIYGVPVGLALVCLAMLSLSVPAPSLALPRLRLPLPIRLTRGRVPAGGAR